MTNQLEPHEWTFLSNHSHVLYCIAYWPDLRIRDIAVQVRITERAVQRIVFDLERAGYLKRDRVGRQNHYRLEPKLPLRHPLLHHVKVGRLLSILQTGNPAHEMTVQNPQDSAVVTPRRRKTVPSRAATKATSRLKKRSKPRKLVARKSV